MGVLAGLTASGLIAPPPAVVLAVQAPSHIYQQRGSAVLSGQTRLRTAFRSCLQDPSTLQAVGAERCHQRTCSYAVGGASWLLLHGKVPLRTAHLTGVASRPNFQSHMSDTEPCDDVEVQPAPPGTPGRDVAAAVARPVPVRPLPDASWATVLRDNVTHLCVSRAMQPQDAGRVILRHLTAAGTRAMDRSSPHGRLSPAAVSSLDYDSSGSDEGWGAGGWARIEFLVRVHGMSWADARAVVEAGSNLYEGPSDAAGDAALAAKLAALRARWSGGSQGGTDDGLEEEGEDGRFADGGGGGGGGFDGNAADSGSGRHSSRGGDGVGSKRVRVDGCDMGGGGSTAPDAKRPRRMTGGVSATAGHRRVRGGSRGASSGAAAGAGARGGRQGATGGPPPGRPLLSRPPLRYKPSAWLMVDGASDEESAHGAGGDTAAESRSKRARMEAVVDKPPPPVPPQPERDGGRLPSMWSEPAAPAIRIHTLGEGSLRSTGGGGDEHDGAALRATLVRYQAQQVDSQGESSWLFRDTSSRPTPSGGAAPGSAGATVAPGVTMHADAIASNESAVVTAAGVEGRDAMVIVASDGRLGTAALPSDPRPVLVASGV